MEEELEDRCVARKLVDVLFLFNRFSVEKEDCPPFATVLVIDWDECARFYKQGHHDLDSGKHLLHCVIADVSLPHFVATGIGCVFCDSFARRTPVLGHCI